MKISSDHAKSSRTAASSETGYTLLEMLVTVALMTIVGIFTVPKVGELLSSFDRRNAEVQIIEDMRLSQATAVEQGCKGIFKVASDGRSYTFGCDYVPYSAATPPEWDATLFTRNLPNNITVSSAYTILFNSRGQAIDTTDGLTTYVLYLRKNEHGTPVTFNTGTLRPTGFFSLGN